MSSTVPAKPISTFRLLHDVVGATESAILGSSIHDREIAFYTFFVKVPSMLTVVVFIACLLFHGRELLDLRYTTAPKYAYLQPWKNSQCKSWLDIMLVVLYQLCWFATLGYYGTEFFLHYSHCDMGPIYPYLRKDGLFFASPNPGGPWQCKYTFHHAFTVFTLSVVIMCRQFNTGGTLMLLSHGLLHIGEKHGIDVKELSILSCKWYAYTSVLSILQAGAGMVGLYARVQAGKPHASSRVQKTITELSTVNYSGMPLLVSSLFVLAFNNSRTPGLTNMCLWKPESHRVHFWVYYHRDLIHCLVLIAVAVPIFIFSNINKPIMLFIQASIRGLKGKPPSPVQPIP